MVCMRIDCIHDYWIPVYVNDDRKDVSDAHLYSLVLYIYCILSGIYMCMSGKVV